MDCVKCGAPLPAQSLICTYCGALNDVDLRAIHAQAKKGSVSDRICPRCNAPLESIDIGRTTPFFIEHCDRCLGLFFDPGELDQLLDVSAEKVHDVDLQRMQTIIEQEGISEFRGVEYIKCPVCRDRMNRKSCGARAGVVVDACKEHGVWLDGGELSQLLKWVKAGGKVHDAEVRLEEANRELRKRKQRMEELAACDRGTSFGSDARCGGVEIGGLLGLLARLLD
jgi:Zn-finger nucleic acid-binding protein